MGGKEIVGWRGEVEKGGGGIKSMGGRGRTSDRGGSWRKMV